jgi:hypothetical protein
MLQQQVAAAQLPGFSCKEKSGDKQHLGGKERATSTDRATDGTMFFIPQQ